MEKLFYELHIFFVDNSSITNYGITMKTRKAVKTYRIDPKTYRELVAIVKAEKKRGRKITASAATAEAVAMWCSMTRACAAENVVDEGAR